MERLFSNLERAEILTQALPYIKKYSGKIVVVKYGGNAMVNEELKQQVMEDIALLWLIGVKVVLVHGGGPEISQAMKRLGKQAVFVDGLLIFSFRRVFVKTKLSGAERRCGHCDRYHYAYVQYQQAGTGKIRRTGV